MIEVHVQKDGVTVAGHAMYAPPGQDIICAGVSTLTQTLLKSMLELTEDKISYNISPEGRVDIHFTNLSKLGRLLVDSFFIGICQIADEYPSFVRIV